MNHGHVPPEYISDLYDDLDVFLFPSFCESFGMPLVEAMTRGLPVIYADTSSNREICDNAGIPFPTHDAAALADAFRRLLDDAGFYQASASASARRATAFSWHSAARSTMTMLENLVP